MSDTTTRTVHVDDLGECLDDDDLIRNGLWARESDGTTADGESFPHALCEEENWDYAEVTAAWLEHAKQRLAVHGIIYDPKTGTAHLPADMAAENAEAHWAKVYTEFDTWISDLVEETRAGTGLAPPDGIRAGVAGARWITWSTA